VDLYLCSSSNQSGLLAPLGSFLLTCDAGSVFFTPKKGSLNTLGIRQLIGLHGHVDGGSYSQRPYLGLNRELKRVLLAHPHMD
jgi:hypothetical protein